MTAPPRSDDGSPETFGHQALAEDTRALVSAIESLHPDPYIGYDGRVDLHARLERTVADLPETTSVEGFYRRAAPLVAGLEDAHSSLRPPESTATSEGTDHEDHRLPVSFAVVGDRLYVDSVFDETLEELLGTHFLAVEDESIGTLAERVATLRGVENQYTTLLFVKWMVEEHDPLSRLLDRTTPPAEPTIRVENGGEECSIPVTPVPDGRQPAATLDGTVPLPDGIGPRYRFYDGGDAAVFVPGDLQGYRESFEAAMESGAASASDLAPAAYDQHVGGDLPSDLTETVAALPSMTEALAGLVDGMTELDTGTLIVDLRDNPGGDSQFVFHVAYALYGWKGVARVAESTRALKRRTPRHRERYGTGSDDSGTTGDGLADYDFSDFLDGVAGDEDEPESRVRERLLRSDTFAEFADGEGYEGVRQPDQLVVAVSAATMSSGFAGAAQLTSLGAEVVGVPSGQAPLSFGEPVEKTLPNTGLTASIAGSMYHWVPDPETNVLRPDRELTPRLFERYGRSSDAVLRLAFDHAEGTNPSDAPPEPFGLN